MTHQAGHKTCRVQYPLCMELVCKLIFQHAVQHCDVWCYEYNPIYFGSPRIYGSSHRVHTTYRVHTISCMPKQDWWFFLSICIAPESASTRPMVVAFIPHPWRTFFSLSRNIESYSRVENYSDCICKELPLSIAWTVWYGYLTIKLMTRSWKIHQAEQCSANRRHFNIEVTSFCLFLRDCDHWTQPTIWMSYKQRLLSISIISDHHEITFSSAHHDTDFYLQASMRKVVKGVGGLDHKHWRSYVHEHSFQSQPAYNFVDGDLVEQFLELEKSSMQKVLAEMPKDFNAEDMSRLVEELSRALH